MFNFDVRYVSCKFTIYLCLHLSQKWLLMRFVLSAVLERTYRFVANTEVVLEEYSRCLSNNKWLGVKHVSIVILMISSTSNNSISSCSKWLQEIGWTLLKKCDFLYKIYKMAKKNRAWSSGSVIYRVIIL